MRRSAADAPFEAAFTRVMEASSAGLAFHLLPESGHMDGCYLRERTFKKANGS
jgi:hypothetical protein